jgi:hypothetical protein
MKDFKDIKDSSRSLWSYVKDKFDGHGSNVCFDVIDSVDME